MNIEFTEIAWEDFSFWIENDENCRQFQAYFCTKCGNYEYLSSLTYDGILQIMCDCD